MKKYILNKEYPKSPKKGSIAIYSTDFINPCYVIGDSDFGWNLTIEEVENYPEYWEKISIL
jgi:hypothetical protein